MRLAVFTTNFPGRVSSFFARDMRALIEAGLEIEVFSVSPYRPWLWQHVPSVLDERVLPRNRVHHLDMAQLRRSLAPVDLRRVGAFARDTAALGMASARAGVGPLVKSMYVVPFAWVWARHFASRFDHVFSYWGNYAATCAYLAHRCAGRRIPFSFQLHAGADLYYNKVFLREKLLYADSVVTVCAFNQRYLEEQLGDIFPRIANKIHVNHMGIDLAEFPFSANGRDPRRVVGVGRFVDTKGYDYLLRAIALLASRGIDMTLELVGDGQEAEALRALAGDLGIQNHVIFRGWLSGDLAREAIAKAAVFVHPSSALGDAKPNVIEEAMALGTPVVASHVSGIPELLDGGQCGILVPPKDVRALADAIQSLLKDPALRDHYARAGRRFAERTLDLWENGRRLAEHLRSVAPH